MEIIIRRERVDLDLNVQSHVDCAIATRCRDACDPVIFLVVDSGARERVFEEDRVSHVECVGTIVEELRSTEQY